MHLHIEDTWGVHEVVLRGLITRFRQISCLLKSMTLFNWSETTVLQCTQEGHTYY